MTNRNAFLTMLSISEGTSTVEGSDNGYNVLVGGTLFGTPPDCYADHPHQLVDLGNGLESTAAGRYQILGRYFDVYKKQLNLPDFSPASQDAIAVQLITECDALDDVDAGYLNTAISKCKSRWASLPGAGYGQHEQKFETLQKAYQDAGGVIVSTIGKAQANNED